MRVFVACEESQVVTIAFRKRGHEAYSCDVIPCSGGHPEWHIQDDCLKHLDDGWDIMIAFPPCTYLSNAGIGWFNEEKYGNRAKQRKIKRQAAYTFFMNLYTSSIPKICIENPVGFVNGIFKPTQIIQPYYFGDNARKRTCLWLKELPALIHSGETDLFYKKTHIKEPTPLKIQYRKPSKYYKGGEEKKRYFTDVVSRKSIVRSKTFIGIANAMADQWGEAK